MTARLRPVGDPVALLSANKRPVDGQVVGYALVHPNRGVDPKNFSGPHGWVFAYIVRLNEGCDTKNGIYMREIPVYPEDLVSSGRER